MKNVGLPTCNAVKSSERSKVDFRKFTVFWQPHVCFCCSTLLFLYKNPDFYQNVEAEICPQI